MVNNEDTMKQGAQTCFRARSSENALSHGLENAWAAEFLRCFVWRMECEQELGIIILRRRTDTFQSVVILENPIALLTERM